MSELLPTLRESLRETAERRHRRRRRRATLLPAAAALAAVVAALLIVRGADTATSPADEVPATPTPTITVTPTPPPAPAPRQMPKLSPKDLRPTRVAPNSPSLKEATSLLDPSHKVLRAWRVPGLEGHVLLTRKGGQWCLSAPDPLTDHPDAERGVGCVPDSRFRRHGAYIGLVPQDGKRRISVTVKPDQKTIRIRQR
jgi:hypothetical protein